MNIARKRLDAVLERLDESGFGYDRQPTDEEIARKHDEVLRQIEEWENATPRQRAYQEWLQSPRWRELRNARLRLDGYICQGCGGTATTAHHVWYPKEEHWDQTPLWTLVSLCSECHRLAHRIYANSAVPWGTHDDSR
jgi:5-methylcytosine-specific restriction endonuclease McrA